MTKAEKSQRIIEIVGQLNDTEIDKLLLLVQEIQTRKILEHAGTKEIAENIMKRLTNVYEQFMLRQGEDAKQ